MLRKQNFTTFQNESFLPCENMKDLEGNTEKCGGCLRAWGLAQFLPLKCVHPELPAIAQSGSSVSVLGFQEMGLLLWEIGGWLRLFCALCGFFLPFIFSSLGDRGRLVTSLSDPSENCLAFFSQSDHLFYSFLGHSSNFYSLLCQKF